MWSERALGSVDSRISHPKFSEPWPAAWASMEKKKAEKSNFIVAKSWLQVTKQEDLITPEVLKVSKAAFERTLEGNELVVFDDRMCNE